MSTTKSAQPARAKHSVFRIGKTAEPGIYMRAGEALRLPSALEATKYIHEGLSYQLVGDFADHIGVKPDSVLFTIGVRGGTAQRRQKEKVLKPAESDRLYRLMRVTALTEQVIEDPAKARTWLQRENRALGGVTPFSLLDTEAGAEAVEELLCQIDHGVYS